LVEGAASLSPFNGSAARREVTCCKELDGGAGLPPPVDGGAATSRRGASVPPVMDGVVATSGEL
jgi:hypothetical protein